ncbi:MAG TPA: hypothetical protein DCM73_11195 [Clostridiales bacterium]|nr:hypothetical protein [Clostridiales bacterium]
MLKIKEFSILSQIGVRMLRHYDNIGLLHPAYVDKNNNYRYYDEEQLLVTNKIQSLKSMGISLKEIKLLLHNMDNLTYMDTYLNKLLIERQKELENLQNSIKHINSALNGINNNSIYGCEITLKEVPQHNVVSVRKKISSYQEEHQLFQTLFREIAQQNIKIQNPLYNVAIYHDKEYKNTNIDIEVQCNVIGNYSYLQNIIFKSENPNLIIAIVIQGTVDDMHGLNTVAANWLKDNQYTFAGPMYNVYHIPPKEEIISPNCLVEVCFPVEKIKFY